MTGTAQTLVNVRLTLSASETGRTLALVTVDSVQTCGTVKTGQRSTIVDIRVTLHAIVSGRTITDVSKVQRPTLAAVLTG